MTAIPGLLTTAAGLAMVAAGLVWLGRRVRRRGAGGEIMGPFEEIWHPAAHRARLEVEVQEERVVPLPSPGDPWRRTSANGAVRLTSRRQQHAFVGIRVAVKDLQPAGQMCYK